MVTEVPLLFGSTGTLLDNRVCLAQVACCLLVT